MYGQKKPCASLTHTPSAVGFQSLFISKPPDRRGNEPRALSTATKLGQGIQIFWGSRLAVGKLLTYLQWTDWVEWGAYTCLARAPLTEVFQIRGG